MTSSEPRLDRQRSPPSNLLRDLQLDPLLGPRRLSTLSAHEDKPKPNSTPEQPTSSLFFSSVSPALWSKSLSHPPDSSLSSSPLLTTSNSSSGTPTFSPSTGPSSALIDNGTSTSSITPSLELHHRQAITPAPQSHLLGSRSNSSPAIAAPFQRQLPSPEPLLQFSHSQLSTALVTQQSNPLSRPRADSAVQVGQSKPWPPITSPTGPLNYIPGRDPLNDRYGWLVSRLTPSASPTSPNHSLAWLCSSSCLSSSSFPQSPTAHSHTHDALSPGLIPRLLSLQETPSVPWLGQERAQSYPTGPNPTLGSNSSAQSLYSEPINPRRTPSSTGSSHPDYAFNSLNSLYSPQDSRSPLYPLNESPLYHLNPQSTPQPLSAGRPHLARTEAHFEEISTVFVIGFPEDMDEREFQNMFIFCPGFEAATLKVPATTLIITVS